MTSTTVMMTSVVVLTVRSCMDIVASPVTVRGVMV